MRYFKSRNGHGKTMKKSVGIRKAACVILALLLFIAGCAASNTGNAQTGDKTAYRLLLDAVDTQLEEAGGAEFAVHYIDVGKADAILIECEEHFMLIDAATKAQSPVVLDYLRQRGVQKLDYVVATHPHEDHIGGMQDIFREFKIGLFIMPDCTHNTATYENMLDTLLQKEIEIEIAAPGAEFSLASADFMLLAPNGAEYADLNDYSVVLRMEYGETSFLFCGDAQKKSEAEMLRNGLLLQADVLKAGHHGSSTSSTFSFVQAVDPNAVVLTCDRDASTGGPHDGPLKTFQLLGAQVFRSDDEGCIVMISDGQQITAITESTNTPQRIESVPEPIAAQVIGNKNTKVYHVQDCSALPKEKNRIYFDSLESAEMQGYRACGNCLSGGRPL
jgi:competence protein ComEC